jgi:Mrp family chromosome partitioning ATPase
MMLSSGAPLETATNYIHSARFRDLLDRFRAEFDYVLIDTPPLMLVPDARVAGQWSDGVILVLRAGQTLQADALAVARRLREDGSRVIGTILNNWRPPGLGKKSYQKYYKYYRHESS